MKIVFLLLAVLLASGCLFTGQKVPVLNVNVTVAEDANKTMVVKGIDAYIGEVPKGDDPYSIIPKYWPAVYVDTIQGWNKVTYQSGIYYEGPGRYDFILGFETNESNNELKINKSQPAIILAYALNEAGERTSEMRMVFNWSTEVQRKTFK